MLASPCEGVTLALPDELERVAESAPRDDVPRRVLHVINGEHYAGAERVQDLLAMNLSRFGFEVGFACLKPGRFAMMRQALHAPLVELGMQSRFDLRPALRLARLVRREQYALVHTHTPRARWWAVWPRRWRECRWCITYIVRRPATRRIHARIV